MGLQGLIEGLESKSLAVRAEPLEDLIRLDRAIS